MQAIAAMIEDKRQAVGVVHLGLYGSKQGLVLSWSQSLEAIAEPSESCGHSQTLHWKNTYKKVL